MAEAAGGSLDPWAEWLIRGRDAGLPAEQVQARARRFQALAGRVLDGARIADGDRVLDATPWPSAAPEPIRPDIPRSVA
jgi:hypothetical protein